MVKSNKENWFLSDPNLYHGWENHNNDKENYHRIIRIDEAAGLVNMSVISFGRLIKQQRGKSITEFLTEVRLGSATRRLIESNESITEICFDCGFNGVKSVY